ncbi:hypothetical protein PAXRUDRAFT_371339 [Paxillus rubicundulus Ve08.2h10]|uniref:Uncharacterized protein n=1 Tax=Paxillus rubicundulus Ve08.2h10 TaxID=930991 RepID=A0A0D0E5P3_9AGAM|nr:hypothetical protein PAXRUDRAFT_371339 [Paxillus rubicundulus Ve08.2h10]
MFEQPSSAPAIPSSPALPASLAFEALVSQDGKTGLTAAVETLEKTHNHKAIQLPCLTSQEHSPPSHSHSQSSTSSRSAVEQQLTQEDEIAPLHDQRLPSSTQISQPQSEPADAELRWPASDEEVDEAPLAPLIPEQVPISDQPLIPHRSPVSRHPLSFPDNGRGKCFRSRSLDIFRPANGHGVGSSMNGPLNSGVSQKSLGSSQPFVLQTQAPYFSQTIDWSQSQ